MNQREQAEKAIETLFRRVTHVTKGQMRIQRIHVSKVIATNAERALIGGNRADKVWSWLAHKVQDGEHKLKNRQAWTQQWLGEGELLLLRARGLVAWEGTPAQVTAVHRREVTGAVRTWLLENEERQKQGPIRVREQKMRQMQAAKKKMASTRGGRMAVYAAMTILTAQQEATLTFWPTEQHSHAPWLSWVRDSVEWMRTDGGWMTDDEAADTLLAATTTHKHYVRVREHLIVDLGEGWRGVGNAIAERFEDTQVVGVDRRGHTYTGSKQGVIISAVKHDFTERGKVDLLTTLEKKVGRAVGTWLMLWMSPECSPLSIGNAMNQAKGAAHGEWAATAHNAQNSTEERVTQEAEYLREALVALNNIL
jgi:hypothetical protein